MNLVTASATRWLEHTKQYYSCVLKAKDVKKYILFCGITCVLLSLVVTHASVATWLLGDATNKDMYDISNYSYISTDDAPALSSNRFHLTMPMTLEDYMPESTYDQILPAIKLSIDDGYFSGNMDLKTPQEWDDAADDATEFIEKRPPKL